MEYTYVQFRQEFEAKRPMKGALVRALDSRVERIYFWRHFFELFAIEKKNSLLKFLTFIKIFNFFYQFLSRRKRRLL